jgi:hypothetical protein
MDESVTMVTWDNDARTPLNKKRHLGCLLNDKVGKEEVL